MTSTPPVRVRLCTIALPAEHGGWGFLLEPLALGLGVAPSWGGLALALATVGAFLLRQPLRISLSDRRRGKRYARTQAADRFGLLYGGLAAVGLLAAVALVGIAVLWPLLLAAPLIVVQLGGHLRNRGRDLLPELAGANGLASVVTSIALAGSESPNTALALWAIVIARNTPSILYVRARLRLDRGKPHQSAPVIAAHGLAVGGILALAAAGLTPMLAVFAMIVLLVRAVVGLSPYRRRVRVAVIGFLEIGYGALTVTLTITGYALGL